MENVGNVVLTTEASPQPKSPMSPAEVGAAGVFPKKQTQNDEATAPLDDQERRAVQKRLARKEEERKAAVMAQGSMSVRGTSSGAFGGTASARGESKGSWLSGRLTGRRTARGGATSLGLWGSLSSRSGRSARGAQNAGDDTGRSMLSTSRSMMTTARSDINTNRYNEMTGEMTVEMTETREIDMSKLAADLPDDGSLVRRGGPGRRTGKTPRSEKKGGPVGDGAGVSASARGGGARQDGNSGKIVTPSTRSRAPRTRVHHAPSHFANNNRMYVATERALLLPCPVTSRLYAALVRRRGERLGALRRHVALLVDVVVRREDAAGRVHDRLLFGGPLAPRPLARLGRLRAPRLLQLLFYLLGLFARRLRRGSVDARLGEEARLVLVRFLAPRAGRRARSAARDLTALVARR